MRRDGARTKKIVVDGDGIAENIAEEDRLSGEGSEEEVAYGTRSRVKKNLLCKNLLDQTKELCYQHSPVYKDFDSMFQKIYTRFVHWELFDDEDIHMAGLSLKVMANSGQIVNLVLEKNMRRLIKVYDDNEMVASSRLAISECFFVIAKNIGLRKIFLQQSFHRMLCKNALAVVNEANHSHTSRRLELYITTVKLLCLVVTAKTTKFYIPGETNLVERLRKRAFDCGTYTLLTYIFKELKASAEHNAKFQEVRDYIREKVLNYAELGDLHYHVRLIKFMQERPVEETENSAAKSKGNSNEGEEESKDDDLILEKIQDENEAPSTQQKRPQLRMNANSGMAGAVYSPKASGIGKGKGMKKANSSL